MGVENKYAIGNIYKVTERQILVEELIDKGHRIVVVRTTFIYQQGIGRGILAKVVNRTIGGSSVNRERGGVLRLLELNPTIVTLGSRITGERDSHAIGMLGREDLHFVRHRHGLAILLVRVRTVDVALRNLHHDRLVVGIQHEEIRAFRGNLTRNTRSLIPFLRLYNQVIHAVDGHRIDVMLIAIYGKVIHLGRIGRAARNESTQVNQETDGTAIIVVLIGTRNAQEGSVLGSINKGRLRLIHLIALLIIASGRLLCGLHILQHHELNHATTGDRLIGDIEILR